MGAWEWGAGARAEGTWGSKRTLRSSGASQSRARPRNKAQDASLSSVTVVVSQVASRCAGRASSARIMRPASPLPRPSAAIAYEFSNDRLAALNDTYAKLAGRIGVPYLDQIGRAHV